MRQFLSVAVTSAALVALPAQAQLMDGATDPAFRAAMDLALNTADPEAVAKLRNLAEAGNLAALVALPFALQWIPPKGSLAEKNAQRKVDGVPAQTAAAKAHAESALWANGLIDTSIIGTDDLLRRSAGLSDLGEPEKAAFLLASWINQTGGSGDLPDTLFSPSTPAWIGALTLTFRLGLSDSSTADNDRLANLLAQDSPSAWIALVHLTERLHRSHASLGDPLSRAGISTETASARLSAAQAMIAVSPSSWREVPVSAETAAQARMALADRIELEPTERLCRVHCPDTRASCETASLAYPGLLFGHYEAIQPFTSVLAEDDFYASDRGVLAMIPQRKDPTAAEDRATAEGLDACYATLLARRDAISLVP